MTEPKIYREEHYTQIGEIDPAFLEQTVEVALTEHGASTSKWKNVVLSLGDLLQGIIPHQVGKKDGPALLQGKAIGGERKSETMEFMDLLILDLDTGENLDDIIDRLLELNLFAVVWTTHSHLKDTTNVNYKQFNRWLKKNEASPQWVLSYLHQVKKYERWILEDATVGEVEHTEDGMIIPVHHEPIPKYRVMLVLTDSFVFLEKEQESKKSAIIQWKELYSGVAKLLGVNFDKSCTDPSRLMYTPRHEEGAEHGIWLVGGDNCLDLDEVEPAPVVESKEAAKNVFTEAAKDFVGKYADFKTEGLAKFMATKASLFEAAEWMYHLHPDGHRSDIDGGFEFECPNDEAHSNAGDRKDRAFIVVNASENDEVDRFHMGCRHDSCISEFENDPARFLDKACQNFGIKHAEELEEFCTEAPEDEDAPPKEDRLPSAIQKLNEQYALITIGGKARILEYPADTDDPYQLLQTDAFRLRLANKKAMRQNKDGDWVQVSLYNEWIKNPDRTEFRGIVFEPGGEVPDYYNLWQGWPVEPAEGDWSILREHLFDNVCQGNEDHFNWVMTWLAQIIQQPRVKLGSALVMRGKKGVGKSKLMQWFAKLFPSGAAITIANSKQIVGQFNKHQTGTLLMIAEEATWAGDREATSVLKNLITSDRIMYESKGIDAVELSNYSRIAFISNENWVIPASASDERRFLVLDVAETRHKDFPYFAAMDQQMSNGGLEALMHELKHWVPANEDWNILRDPPRTQGLIQQAEHSLETEERFMLEFVRTGEVGDEDIGVIALNENRCTEVPYMLLRQILDEFIRKIGDASRYRLGSTSELKRVAQEYLNITTTRDTKTIHGKTYRLWIVPSRADLAEYYMEKFGIDINEAAPEEESNVVHL